MDTVTVRHQIMATIKSQSGGVEMDSDLVTLDSDEALVQRFQRGDLTAFNVLFLKYEQQIYRQILSMVSNPQDAEDIKIEVFWKVYQQLFTLYLKHSFKAWISTIVRNSSIDYLRRLKSKELPVPLDDYEVTVFDQSPSPEEKVIADDLMREALQQLKPRLREILLLDAQGYELEEIARRLGLKACSVATLLSKARNELRQFFHDSVRRRKYAEQKPTLRLLRKKKPDRNGSQQ